MVIIGTSKKFFSCSVYLQYVLLTKCGNKFNPCIGAGAMKVPGTVLWEAKRATAIPAGTYSGASLSNREVKIAS